MVDVMVTMPGSSAKEVEERATRPMEKLLWEIPGVEYLYSTSRDSESLVIVRFKVGSDPQESLVRLTEKLRSNFDRIPHGVAWPLIKPKSIDDVPILALTFHSARYDHLTLRRLVAQVDDAVKQVPLVAETTIIGGARRELRVLLDPVKLASRNLSAAGLIPMLQQANRQFRAGGLTSGNQSVIVETGAFLQTREDVGNVVVGVFGGRPVYLKEVAEIVDGAEEPSNYVLFGERLEAAKVHCVQPLTWSAQLASEAQAWANKCSNTHSTAGGENLAFFFPSATNVKPTRIRGRAKCSIMISTTPKSSAASRRAATRR